MHRTKGELSEGAVITMIVPGAVARTGSGTIRSAGSGTSGFGQWFPHSPLASDTLLLW